ncbi:MAG: NAD-dependent protein deacylase [Deltaproteobacteria bacterium]|nr:NAD-dependent protein deacylase [Nannocystaceae bacterium]
MNAEIDAFASAVRAAERVLVITGAGVSADSGLPTYRGVGGLYEEAITEDGVAIEDALSGEMMASNPALCWKHIHRIEQACRSAEPNAAHRVIAALQDRVELCVLTQNVDGLHRRAGTRDPIEIHGDVHELMCTRCSWRARVPDYSGLHIPPACAKCGGLVRPQVVLFGELLPARAVARLHEQLRRGFDLVISVGTTSAFPYIAQPVVLAAAIGATTIEVNPGDTAVSQRVDLRIRERAAPCFSALWSALGGTTTMLG